MGVTMTTTPGRDPDLPGGGGPDRRVRLAAAVATVAIGTPLLRMTLESPRGGTTFLRRTVALAGVWTAGAAVSGHLRRERWGTRRDGTRHAEDLTRPALVAAGAVGVFAAGALVVSRVPALRREIDTVLAHAERGNSGLVIALALVTGAAEEVFFRGTVPDLAAEFGLPPLATSSVAYAAVTCATRNPLLVLAAGALGVLAGAERSRSGGLVAPVVVHLGWSFGMVELLPRITRRERVGPPPA